MKAIVRFFYKIQFRGRCHKSESLQILSAGEVCDLGSVSAVFETEYEFELRPQIGEEVFLSNGDKVRVDRIAHEPRNGKQFPVFIHELEWALCVERVDLSTEAVANAIQRYIPYLEKKYKGAAKIIKIKGGETGNEENTLKTY